MRTAKPQTVECRTARVPERSTLTFCGSTFCGSTVHLLLFLLLGASVRAHAQSYFQQRVDHRIQVRLDDVRHTLHAYEEFDYHNNAPVALDTIWVHLWPNAYKDRSTALCKQQDAANEPGLHFAPAEDRGHIDSLDFRWNGTPLAWGLHPNHIDIGWIKLPVPLVPGASITIGTPFHVKIPDGRFSRLGHSGQAYYITQWFPKPAVYDAQGWHAMPYLNQGEFYSEYGRYDVSITLPANYVVGATGVLQNEQERELMDRMASGEWKYPEPMTDINTGKPLYNNFPASSTQMKTLRYVQDNVHDFAWFADKRFIVRKGSVTLPHSGRTVTTWALSTPRNAKLWEDAVNYVNESVRFYSTHVGDYPYDACTAIDGTISAGGGMEYPMITIIGNMDDEESLDNVIAHEVGHNWFYGILGSNERDHGWMDEGMNSFLELRYMRARYPNSGLEVGLPKRLLEGRTDLHRLQSELMYRFNARRNLDQPIGTTSDAFTGANYGTIMYGKTALVMDHLMAWIGEVAMDSCLRAYFNEWKFKHPQPGDLRSVFERASGKDLGWVFDQFIGKALKIETCATSVHAGGVRFKTNTLAPFPITAWSKGDSLGTVWSDSTRIVWDRPDRITRPVMDEAFAHKARGSQASTGELSLPWPDVDRIRIDAGNRTLDIDRRNNEMRAHGLFKRTRLPELQFLAGLERDDRRSLYWIPALGYNAHDGWMPGITLRNTTFPSQRLEWVAAPLYGTQSQRLAGGARVLWHHDRLRSDLFRNVHIGVSGFAASLWNEDDVEQWYQRVVPSIQFDLRTDPRAAQTDIRYRSVLLWDHAEGSIRAGDRETQVDEVQENIFHEVRLQHRRRNGLHPFDLQLISLNHQAFNRLALDAKWSAVYDRHKHRVTFRGFGGVFVRTDDRLMQAPFGWRLHWGSSDLLRDNLFFERQYLGQNTAQQFAKEQGGFKTPTANGTSDSWIAALNMEADFPFQLPLSLFASYGMAPYTIVDQNGMRKDLRGYWEMGIGVRIVRDVVEAWIPLAYSTEIKNEVETLRNFDFTERIRFVLALERMDPTQALRRAPH